MKLQFMYRYHRWDLALPISLKYFLSICVYYFIYNVLLVMFCFLFFFSVHAGPNGAAANSHLSLIQGLI